MKLNKNNLSFAVFILGFFLVSNTVGAQTASTTGAAPRPDTRKPIEGRKEMEIRKNIDVRKNVEERKEVRDEKKMEVKNIKETSRAEIKDLKEKMVSERMNPRDASTTEARKEIRLSNKESMQDFKTARKDVVRKMKTDEFKVRADALVKQLKITLTNLSDIRTKVSVSISKQEAEGKVLTEAKAALAVADAKLAEAKLAVDSLANISTIPTTASTTETDITKPRQIGDAAIKAVKDARNSLKLVVKSISNKSEAASSTSITN
jgi:hypothetical protein